MNNGLDAYFDWAHRKADRMRENLLLALLAVALAGCAIAPKAIEPKDEVVNPIAAFDFSQCGGALVLYVVVDQTHVLRFDQKQTTIFVFENGKMSQTFGPPTPFSQALKIAESAGITSNAIAPCGHPETET